MRINETKFGIDRKVEFKNSFELYRQKHEMDESEQNIANI
jgi:hypothetical protein